jgi:soluble lytic murein transglycosylase
MREESGFDPKIVSYAHAVGLMQLLEKTASGMARRDVSARELYQPELNVALGTKYVRYLLDRFGHPVLAVAGYNSGPGGVLRTLKRTTGREIDEFVEWIPYDQTSRYTKRVLSSAWVYQVLYGDTEGPAPFPLTFPKQKKGK